MGNHFALAMKSASHPMPSSMSAKFRRALRLVHRDRSDVALPLLIQCVLEDEANVQQLFVCSSVLLLQGHTGLALNVLQLRVVPLTADCKALTRMHALAMFFLGIGLWARKERVMGKSWMRDALEVACTLDNSELALDLVKAMNELILDAHSGDLAVQLIQRELKRIPPLPTGRRELGCRGLSATPSFFLSAQADLACNDKLNGSLQRTPRPKLASRGRSLSDPGVSRPRDKGLNAIRSWAMDQ